MVFVLIDFLLIILSLSLSCLSYCFLLVPIVFALIDFCWLLLLWLFRDVFFVHVLWASQHNAKHTVFKLIVPYRLYFQNLHSPSNSGGSHFLRANVVVAVHGQVLRSSQRSGPLTGNVMGTAAVLSLKHMKKLVRPVNTLKHMYIWQVHTTSIMCSDLSSSHKVTTNLQAQPMFQPKSLQIIRCLIHIWFHIFVSSYFFHLSFVCLTLSYNVRKQRTHRGS